MNYSTDEPIPNPLSADFERALDRVMNAGKYPQDILDRPIGPSLQCYSIRHMVDLFRWGAGKSDVAHLASCPACRSWSNNYARTESARVAQEKAQGKAAWRDWLPDWFGTPAPQPIPVAPMLYVKQEIIPAGKPFEIALVAGIADPSTLDPASLRLEGGLSSSKGTILHQKIEGMNCAVIRFDDLVLSDSLKRDVQNHATVVQNVALVGKLIGSAEGSFRGQANLYIGARPASA